jgi:acylphosphatase
LNPEPTIAESRRVLYTGQVQGVGFRYTARQIAQRRPVTGFVRNLPDGRVELLVEGPPAELDGLIADIASAMSDYIRKAKVQTIPASGKYTSFEVAF